MRRVLRLALAALLLAPAAARAAAESEAERAYLKGLVHERFGRPVDALDFYRRAAALDPSALFLQRSLAELCLRIGRLDEALDAARRAESLAEKDPALRVLRGRVHLARGERAEAGRAFEQALALDPAFADGLIYAAYLKSAEDDPGGAIAFLERYLEENPESPEALARIAQLQEDRRDFKAAEAAWRRVAARDPGNPDAPAALGRLLAARGKLDDAIQHFSDARALAPARADILIPLADVLYRRDRAAEAKEALEQALRASPADASAHYRLAQIAQDEEDWPAAIAHMHRTLALSPHPDLWPELAHMQLLSGAPRDAVRTLRRARRERPADAGVWMTLGMAYEELGRRRAAARAYDEAARLDASRADAPFRAAVNWDAAGRFGLAEPRLEEAIRREPRHAAALNYLGFSWADRGRRLPEALALIRRALEVEPENAAFLDSLGWCLFKMGKTEEALAPLSRAAPRESEAEVWEHLGDVLSALGRVDEAARAWEEAQLADPARASTRRRLGRRPATFRLAPVSAARSTLKRVESLLLPLRSAGGAVGITVSRGPFSAGAEGVFYYRRPGDFRIEVLGAFFAPEAVIVRNAGGLHVAGAESPVPPEAALAALDLLGQALSGAATKRFDSAGTSVRRDGSRLTYTDGEAELVLDGKAKRFLSFSSGGVAVSFDGDRGDEGLWWPAEIRISSAQAGLTLTLAFRSPRLGAPLPDELFAAPEAP